MSITFKCTHCGQPLRAQASAAGKRCKCTKCGQLVPIPAAGAAEKAPQAAGSQPPAAGPVARPIARPIAKPVQRPRNPLLEELNQLPRGKQAEHVYPPMPTVESQAPRQTSYDPIPKKYQAKSRRKRSSSGGSGVAMTLVTVFSVLALLCCGGLGVVGWVIAPKTQILQAGGYQAAAKGNRTQQRTEAGGETQGTMHPFTGSEFWIGAIPIPMGNAASLEDVRFHFGRFSQNTEYVQRGGIQGVRCEQVDTGNLGMPSGITAEIEVFLVDGRLLYLAYIPGSSKRGARGGGSSAGATAREATLDQSQAFFDSLQRTTGS